MLAFLDPRRAGGSRRSTERRKLYLLTEGSTLSASAVQVVIHDISPSGLLVETSAELSVGERLEVEIPEAGRMEAEVVWNEGNHFGCNFKSPISIAATSAALLRSPPAEAKRDRSETVPEPPRGQSTTATFLFYTAMVSAAVIK